MRDLGRMESNGNNNSSKVIVGIDGQVRRKMGRAVLCIYLLFSLA